jgi:hypothetical protein
VWCVVCEMHLKHGIGFCLEAWHDDLLTCSIQASHSNAYSCVEETVHLSCLRGDTLKKSSLTLLATAPCNQLWCRVLVVCRYYQRLLQMGVSNTEIWTNLGLCCFYASQ